METKIREKKNMFWGEPSPDDIAGTIAMFAGEYANDQVVEELTDALYALKAIARNEYNSDYWRTLWDALLVTADKNPAAIPF